MPIIDRNIVNHLAKLSRLSLTDEEADGFARDLNTIIGHANDLKKADAEGVSPMIGAADMKNIMRTDEETAKDMAFEPSFPETQDERLKVPKIL